MLRSNLNTINARIFNKTAIRIDDQALREVEACYRFLEKFEQGKVIYGINTGFGPMAQYRIGDADLNSLQYNIIRSHSCGAGEALPDICVRAAMLARLQTFLNAKSGVHPDVVRILADFLNNEIYPLVPRHGSVGASGDLVQLAHIALALIGGVVILAFTKLYGTVFLGAPRTHEVAEASEVDNFRIAAMALPLAGILFIGLFPQTAVSAVTRAAGFFIHHPADAADYLLSPTLAAVSRTAWLLILVVGLLAWLRSRALRTRKVTDGATWGCGFTSPNVRMQYSGESYSEGLQSIATSLTQNSGEGSAVGKGEIFPAAHNFDIRHKDRFDKLFAAWWVELLRVINKRAMRLRTGKINHYVLFALAFLVLIFLLSIFNLI